MFIPILKALSQGEMFGKHLTKTETILRSVIKKDHQYNQILKKESFLKKGERLINSH